MNTGHFFIKNSAWSLAFLKECYGIYPPPVIFANGMYHRWQDQGAIRTYIDRHPEFLSKIKLCSQRDFNSYVDCFEHGDFILHFAGGNGNGYKLAMMKKFSRQVIRPRDGDGDRKPYFYGCLKKTKRAIEKLQCLLHG